MDIQVIQNTFVDLLKSLGYIRSSQVEEAFRKIPRHIFVPNVSIEEAYQNKPVSTKRDDMLGSISSSSAPGLMAQMLELLDLKKGQKVLEIGAGTGFNAALISNIIGSEGKVVTIDIDEDICEDARSHLKQLGISNVDVICTDGTLGYKNNAPYDRIILTVGVPDISSSWFDQLKIGGLLLIPLELTELESVMENPALIVFEKKGEKLESKSIQRCGFMRLRGISATTPRKYLIPAIPGLSIATSQKFNIDKVGKILVDKSSEVVTDISIGYRELFGLQLWFALRCPNYCFLFSKGDDKRFLNLFTRDRSIYSTAGICFEDGLSMLSLEHELKNNNDVSKIVVKSYGNAKELEKKNLEQLKIWNESGRPMIFDKKDIMQKVKIYAYKKGLYKKNIKDEYIVHKPSADLVIKLL